MKDYMSNTQYDVAKKAVTVVIPATGSLYFGLSQIFGLPGGEEVVGSLALLATFLGTVLNISTNRYEASGAGYQGHFAVETDPGGVKSVQLVLDGDPETILENASALRFRVQHEEAQPE